MRRSRHELESCSSLRCAHFVCGGEQPFSSHMHISLRQPSDSTARFAVANEIPFEVVDGNDVLAVADAAGRLIEQARSGGGPGF